LTEGLDDILAIASARRRRNYEEFNRCIASVPELVRPSGSDVQTFAGCEMNEPTVEFHAGAPRDNEEELLRYAVIVRDLALPDRDPLVDHAQSGILEKVPTITAVAPPVVFGICD
jgi:hypothetical protein